ncbi:MAG: D-alanine--D-alanine ligase [Microbacteriaceae bacterium]|nr:D-alanine--D-alanine ligase [Microbacteriaceae bacterium]
MAKIRVLLLFGGRSSEHSISCATAAGVMGAIDRNRFELVPVGITRGGTLVPVEDDAKRWALSEGELPTVEFAGTKCIWPELGDKELRTLDEAGKVDSLGEIDVVFPVLHGPYGEDGTIQGLLELLDMPYVGNGVFASAAGMDKDFTKALFQAAGIPVTPHVVIREGEWLNDPEHSLAKVRDLGALPLFVKPARAGSSVGVSKVSDMAEFADAVALALDNDNKVVVERGLVGREVECAVLGGRDGKRPRVSVAGEIIVTGRDFYDFEAKYRDEASVELVVPASLSAAELDEMQSTARRAFEAIGGAGLARVDFFLTKDGFFVNEINTMPGFTPLSMFPMLWQASGIAYADLISELIELALEGHL